MLVWQIFSWAHPSTFQSFQRPAKVRELLPCWFQHNFVHFRVVTDWKSPECVNIGRFRNAGWRNLLLWVSVALQKQTTPFLDCANSFSSNFRSFSRIFVLGTNNRNFWEAAGGCILQWEPPDTLKIACNRFISHESAFQSTYLQRGLHIQWF